MMADACTLPPGLKDRVVRPGELGSQCRDAMFALFAQYYANVTRTMFEADLDAKDLVILRALGEVQSLLGRNDEARKSYGAVIAASPRDASAMNSYALLLHRIKDPEAMRVAERAVKLAPSQAVYADTYGWLLAESGDLDNGVRVLRDARLREPGNGQIRWHLASALAKAGHKQEAKEELKAALASTSPPVPGPELAALKASLGL